MSFTSTILAYNILVITKHQFRSLSLNRHRSEYYDIAFRSLYARRQNDSLLNMTKSRERISEKDRLNETEEEGKRKRENDSKGDMRSEDERNQSRIPMRGEGDLL